MMQYSDDEDKVINPYKRKNNKKNGKKSMQQKLKEIYEAGDPEVHLLDEPSGAWEHYTTQAREEYLAMKCCSFKRKDLKKHYEKMCKRFYTLGGIDDVNLKQAYLKSLLEPLVNETVRILSMKNMALHIATFGELYQTSLAALEKHCNHQKFLQQLQERGKLLITACDRSELSIKCSQKKCGCSSYSPCTKRKEGFLNKGNSQHFPIASLPSYLHRNSDMIYGLLKLYILLRGLDWRLIENLPYHPQYPFLTTFELNDEFLDRFSKDVYLMLWYLAEICTIKIQVHADALLRYLARCLLSHQDREFKVFYQWLTLFQDATWWQENIRKTMSMLSVTVTFRIKTTIIQEDRNIKVQKKFEAKMAPELRICAIIHRDRPGPGILAQEMEASKKDLGDDVADEVVDSPLHAFIPL
ncbi:hypothetical protein LIER_24822 [Lithospermum erythrorhizon]|uniref:Uncharacterized protein n=1 Tax=Lithospermum erythrorhizon TaxID=34254 RepID=A0AAV3R6I7_LITER